MMRLEGIRSLLADECIDTTTSSLADLIMVTEPSLIGHACNGQY